MLDVECSVRGTAESYIAKVKVQHKQNPRLFEPKPLEPRTFGIQHFAGQVVYDASDFLGKQNSGICYCTAMLLPYILESNPHPNLIRTSFCRFLKRKKS